MKRITPAFRWLLWLLGSVICYYAYRLLHRTLLYTSFATDTGFLVAKQAVLDSPVYLMSFYFHVFASWPVLLLGLFQFSSAIYRRWPRWHRYLGRTYGVLVLLCSAPAGLWIATAANGGLPGEMAFLLQAVLWWGTTAMGWYYARKRRWPAHLQCMVYSYALALGAISLRVYVTVLPSIVTAHPMEVYISAAWLSWVGNLMLAKVLLQLGLERHLLTRFGWQRA